MPDAAAIRIIVVDDHPVVRFGLVSILSLQPDMVVVADVGSGEEACALCSSRPADVVLMDLRLPGMSGADAIRGMRQKVPDLRFIVLTTYDGDEDISKALEAGAHAYLLKGMAHTDVTNAIRKVHSGSRLLPDAVSRRLSERPPHSELSPRELQVLRLIADGLSNKEIGASLGITEATVKWHVNIILSRMNVSDRTQAIVAALRRGIMRLP